MPKFTRNFIISEKLGYLSEKVKTLTSSSYHKIIFYAEISHTFPNKRLIQTGVWDFFLIWFRS